MNRMNHHQDARGICDSSSRAGGIHIKTWAHSGDTRVMCLSHRVRASSNPSFHGV